MTNNKTVINAMRALLGARSNQMLTVDEWEAVAGALEQETGERVEWRTADEMKGQRQ